MSKAINSDAILIGGVVLIAGVAGYALWKTGGRAVQAAGGLITGNNAITQNATDMDGNRVTAYEGGGIVGTVGAATNAASGGVLATFGNWIGGKVYDWTHDTPNTAAVRQYEIPIDTNGSDGGAAWD